MRLASGMDIRFGNENLTWAEVGTNPRDDSNETESSVGRGKSVEQVRENFVTEGWNTYLGPSKFW